ncbi:MAG: winged helix-turn-helix domain-containing protein, partial [Thermoanaerobaculia bacterium]|nr:winged helix-turn-helix domain-containing protein [Thermoanaerobaculia bacterium]
MAGATDAPVERYRIHDLTVDVGTMEVRRGAALVDLPPLSFDLLVALARRAPRPVPTDELIDAVWGDVAIADETLFQRVSLLRRALGDEARSPRYVESVRGRGYRLRAERIGSSGTADSSPVERISRPAVAVVAATAAIVLLAVVVLGWLRAPAGRSDAETASQQSSAAVHPTSATVDEMLRRADEYVRRHRAEDNELAIDLYSQVLKRNTELPQALVGMSFALSQRATKFSAPIEHARRAEDLARRALELEPESARGHLALGLSHDARGQVTAALEAYGRAYTLDSTQVGALASAAHLLQVRGDLAEALATNARSAAALARGAEANVPYLDLQIAATLELLHFRAGADVFFERLHTLYPDGVFTASTRARAQLSRGMSVRAEEIARAALERGTERPDLWVIR